MRNALACLILLLGIAPTWAADPVVAFRVEDGWVRFAVSRDDQPVPDVALRVIDKPGAPYVEGEADEKGVGSFPLPASADCVVTFTLAGREADPILIRFPDKKKGLVEPARVLITFDRRPCCTLSKLRPPGGTGFRWLVAAQAAAGLACLGGCAWLYFRGQAKG